MFLWTTRFDELATITVDQTCQLGCHLFSQDAELRLPVEFFVNTIDGINPTEFVREWKLEIHQFPRPTREVGSHPVYVHVALNTASHIFIRWVPVKKALQTLYQGPYKVLYQKEKYCTIDINGIHKMISLYRLMRDIVTNTPKLTFN